MQTRLESVLDLEGKVKITVVRKFCPMDILGHEVAWQGKSIGHCSLEIGRTFIMHDHLTMPEGFCGRAWQDLYTTLMVYYFGGDYGYPEPGVTYQPCGDGLKPVVFRIEKTTG